MPRLINAITGVIVNVDDVTAANLGSGWQSEDEAATVEEAELKLVSESESDADTDVDADADAEGEGKPEGEPEGDTASEPEVEAKPARRGRPRKSD